jgi:hypothetical protein
VEVDGLSPPEVENGKTKDIPNVATHKKPKAYVMFFEFP